MRCASCGTENRTGSKFCDNCGTPLSPSCPVCGEPNRSDARFCASCGTPFTADQPQPAPTTASAAAQLRPGATAERRLVTMLFTDLVGFTTLAEDRDPEAVRDLLSHYFDATTEVITRHGGTIEKFIGDAVMAVWGTPIAHEDDAERAVRAALEVVDAVAGLHPGLQARAGVLTGEAAVTLGATNQGMVAGDLVNTAARLQGVAEPGTVLVGEATRLAAERSILFEPVGEHSLKGKTSPVPAWRAVRVVAQRGGQGRADALEAPFVGRDEELRQLKEHLHAVGRERKPRLVSIAGPGGIGKTRLVWELEKYIDGVSEAIWWHRGRSPSYGEGITFWALGEMVRRRCGLVEDADEATTRQRVAATVDEYVDPERRAEVAASILALLGIEPAPTKGRDALFPAWRAFFENIAERGTTVLVFEDLQWADAGLLDFIDHLLDWSRSLPIVIVTLARPELFDRRPDWGAGRRSFVAMTLEPLSADEIRTMLDGLAPGLPEDVASAIVGRSDGVPLYAVETVRALLSQGRLERVGDEYRPVGDLSTLTVPESLRSLIASRLDALGAEDRGLLQAAAVLGQVFAAPALAAITARPGADIHSALRGLLRRELIELETDPRSPERGQYKFMQALIREVAYGTMGRRERRALHLAAARHYEAIGDDELAGALASHYLAAHDASDEGPEAAALAAQARIALRAAASRAADLGAHAQAVTHLEQALEIAVDPRERADILMHTADSAGASSTVGAADHAATAAGMYRELGDPVAEARARMLHGRLLLDASVLDQAAAVLEAALAAAPDGEPAIEAELAANLSRAYMRLVRSDEAVTAADLALALAERLDLDDVLAEALLNKGSALGMLGRTREAVLLLEGSVRFSRGGPVARAIRARHNLGVQLYGDDADGAREHLLATLELSRDVGDHTMHAWVAGTLTFLAMDSGTDVDGAVVIAREALETVAIRGDRGRLRAALGYIEVSRGEHLDEVLADMEDIYGATTDPEERLYRDAPSVAVAWVRGQLEEAHRLGMALGQLPTQAQEWGFLFALRAALAARDADRARRASDRLAGLPPFGKLMAAHVARGRAGVAALEGRQADAVAEFRIARETTRRIGHWGHFAMGAVDAVSVLPDDGEVTAWVAEARPILERMRLAPELARLDAVPAAASPKAAAPVLAPGSTVGRD